MGESLNSHRERKQQIRTCRRQRIECPQRLSILIFRALKIVKCQRGIDVNIYYARCFISEMSLFAEMYPFLVRRRCFSPVWLIASMVIAAVALENEYTGMHYMSVFYCKSRRESFISMFSRGIRYSYECFTYILLHAM